MYLLNLNMIFVLLAPVEVVRLHDNYTKITATFPTGAITSFTLSALSYFFVQPLSALA